MTDQVTRNVDIVLNKFGPITKQSRSLGHLCAACSLPLRVGDFYCGYPVGPGINPINRALFASNEPYRPCFALVHWSCGTGLD